MGLLVLIMGLGTLMAVAWGFCSSLEEDWVKTAISVLIAIALIFGIVGIVNTDDTRALNSNAVYYNYARIDEITSRSIEFDDDQYTIYDNNCAVTLKYPVDYSQLKVGDIVKYEYISADFHNYIIKVTKVTAEDLK